MTNRSTNTPRVLLVDDDRSIVEALAARLSREFEVTTAVSAHEALELVSHEAAFAVIVVDIRMPGCDGNRLLARVRDLDSNIVRMVLTGHADTETAILAINEGHCFRFLCKPCPFDQLRAAVAAGVEQHRLITRDRKLTQSRLAAMAQQLARSERLATLGSMAAAAGHELSNIAAALVGVLDLVEKNNAGEWVVSSADRDDLQRISQHVSHFGRQLLHLGRGGATATPPQRLDLGQAVRDVLGMLTALGATKSVRVSFDAPADEAPVLLSRIELEQVMVNLVRNAIDALETSNADPKRVWLKVEAGPEGRVQCSVADNGPGISNERVGQIFEPYFTTKSAERGTGLGLSVVRQIVEAASGKIAVDSHPGRGTRFVLSFPTHRAAATLET